MLMDTQITRTTTNLVGSSLREIESEIRSMLLSMSPDQLAREESTRSLYRDSVNEFCDQLDALRERTQLRLDVLGSVVKNFGPSHQEQVQLLSRRVGFSEKDEIVGAWLKFAKALSTYTHRNSPLEARPADVDFLDWWKLGQAVLHRITLQFETIFAEAVPQIRALAALESPTVTDRARLANVPHGSVAMKVFFENATPGWIELLSASGYFRSPPAPEPDEEGFVTYVPWPPAAYLLRLVAEEPCHERLIEIAAELAESDNPAVQEAVIDIALALPAEVSAVLADQIAGYLSSPYQWQLPPKARDLVIYLANAEQVDGALVVLQGLISPSTPRSGAWQHLSLLEVVVPKIFPGFGLPGLELLADKLAMYIALDPTTQQDDYSYIWRRSIKSGRRRGEDIRDALVTALYEASVLVAEDDPSTLKEIVDRLEAHESSIFRRLVLELLRRVPSDELIAERLGDHELFEDFNLEREWTLLAQERFASLPPQVQERILGWIEAGPEDEEEDEDPQEHRERWQRLMLLRLGEGLAEEWRKRRDELVARYGEPGPPIGDRVTRRVPREVISKEELASKSIDEIRDFLKSWGPGDRFEGPTEEDLANVLAEVVKDDPKRFAEVADSFIDIDPTYVRFFLQGLDEVAREEQQFGWEPMLRLGSLVLEQPRLIEGRAEDPWRGLDGGWINTRRQIARLVSTGLSRSLIPAELADHVWVILVSLTDDPEPDMAYEEGWEVQGSGPLSLSMNTMRGVAMGTIFRFMWWRKQQTPAGKEPRLEERLREVLSRRLDPAIEPTRTIRSVYGEWFPYIEASDHEWASEKAESIFGAASEPDRLGRAAWDSYLFHNRAYDSVVILLREHYIAAIERIANGESENSEVREQLLRHLVYLYVSGQTTLEDDLFGLFLSAAPLDDRTRMIEMIGFDLEHHPLREERLARLGTLWESRLETLSGEGPGALRELRGFSWWFGSGRFDDDWSLEQLIVFFEAGGTVDSDHVVVERLGELLEEHPRKVVRALTAMIEVTDDPWFVIGSREGIRTILQAGLRSGDNCISQSSIRAINRLFAKGHAGFIDLLPQ